jgi:energy-converting hydrogenase Eha subunit F
MHILIVSWFSNLIAIYRYFVLSSFEPERDYPKFVVENSIEPLAPYDDVYEDAKPKQNVEYLPFWRQLPQKKGEV